MKWPLSEAEKLFHDEVREKKKTASGVHHKTGKNGYTGKIIFPTDLMSRKEKYNHRKAGKVLLSNLYEQILPIDEFEKLETYEKRNMLQYWRTQKQNRDIWEAMGVPMHTYYEIVKELDLPKAPRVNKDQPKRSGKKAVKAEAISPVAIVEEKTAKPAPVQEIIVNGLHLVFNGEFTAETIQKQLAKFGAFLEGETDQYYIELKIMQREKVETDNS